MHVRFSNAHIDLAADDVFLKPEPGISVEADVTNAGSCFVVDGTLWAELELTCDRCLKRYDWAHKSPLHELYCHGEEATPSEADDEESEDEVERHLFTGYTFDLSDAVREQLLVSLPMKWVCNDACAGICSHCGKDLNQGPCNCEELSVDPRLGALQDWLKAKGRE